jgi:GDP-L-fucose synthase
MPLKKKVLITGGSGLVGNAIKKISDTYKDTYEFTFLSSTDCNLLDFYETIELFNTIKPHYVIHLAANVGGLYKNMNQKVQMLEDNVLMNIHVLRCAHIVKVEKLIATLSTCIFPDNVEYPINESMLHNGPPHSSNDSYAYAKRLLQIQCASYNKQYGTNFMCIIPTNIYGEYDNFNLDDSHVIPGLIHKCYLAKKNDEKFVIKGSGKPLRQFIYSIDLAHILLLLLHNDNNKVIDSVILSPGKDAEYSIQYIAEIIAKKFDYLHKLEYDTSYSDGQYKKTCDNTKLMNIIDKFTFTDIHIGLEKTIDWFIENYENIRK